MFSYILRNVLLYLLSFAIALCFHNTIIFMMWKIRIWFPAWLVWVILSNSTFSFDCLIQYIWFVLIYFSHGRWNSFVYILSCNFIEPFIFGKTFCIHPDVILLVFDEYLFMFINIRFHITDPDAFCMEFPLLISLYYINMLMALPLKMSVENFLNSLACCLPYTYSLLLSLPALCQGKFLKHTPISKSVI